MNTTIVISFDSSALPAWAQRLPEVVEKCKNNYAYRCNVCAATTPAMRNVLKVEAAHGK